MSAKDVIPILLIGVAGYLVYKSYTGTSATDTSVPSGDSGSYTNNGSGLNDAGANPNTAPSSTPNYTVNIPGMPTYTDAQKDFIFGTSKKNVVQPTSRIGANLLSMDTGKMANTYDARTNTYTNSLGYGSSIKPGNISPTVKQIPDNALTRLFNTPSKKNILIGGN